MPLTVIQKVQQLKAERALHQQVTPVVPEEPQTVVTKVLGGLITIETPVSSPKVDVPTPDNTSALATQEWVGELNTVIAGQSAELAQLRQAVLVLAKSAQSIEKGQSALYDGISLAVQQTAPKIKSWTQLRKELNSAWRDIIDDVDFFVSDARLLATGRVVQTFMSFGTASAAQRHASMQDCRRMIKSIKHTTDRIQLLHDLAVAYYPVEAVDYIKTAPVLTIEKTTWSFSDLLTTNFVPSVDLKLKSLFGL